MWAVVVKYAQAADIKRPGKRFNVPGAELGSVCICGAGIGGTGSTRVSLGVDVATEDEAREVGVHVANLWAVAWGCRPAPVGVEVRPAVGTPEPVSVR
jgi:hypothetical protein